MFVTKANYFVKCQILTNLPNTVISSSYTVHTHLTVQFHLNCRLLSRVVIIPFSSPGIQARTHEQRIAFSALKELKMKASMGFIIALGKRYRETGAFAVDENEKQLATVLPSCSGRTIKGYANLLWFTEQVHRNAIMCICGIGVF